MSWQCYWVDWDIIYKVSNIGTQPRHLEGTGQVLSCTETLQPHPVIGLMVMEKLTKRKRCSDKNDSTFQIPFSHETSLYQFNMIFDKNLNIVEKRKRKNIQAKFEGKRWSMCEVIGNWSCEDPSYFHGSSRLILLFYVGTTVYFFC